MKRPLPPGEYVAEVVGVTPRGTAVAQVRGGPSDGAVLTFPVAQTTKAPRRLTRKQVDKIIAEYDLPGKVRAHLETLGDLVWKRPVEVESASWGERFHDTTARYRDAVVLTRRGPLGVSVYEDWIACVFDDAEAGSHVGASRPSGKWNHHAFVGYCHAPTSREEMIVKLDEMLHGFVSELAWLVDRRFTPETRAALRSAPGGSP